MSPLVEVAVRLAVGAHVVSSQLAPGSSGTPGPSGTPGGTGSVPVTTVPAVAGAGSGSTGGIPDGEAIRTVAEQIVARPEFVEQRPSLLERFGEWLARQLTRLPFDEVPAPSGSSASGGGRGSSGLLTVLLVIVGVVVLLAVVRWMRRNGPPGRRRRNRATEDVVVEDRRPLGEDELAALAARHEAAGDWPEAVRARYRWAVTALRRQGAVGAEPGRTSGELRREVTTTAPAAGTAFEALTDTFEAAWYAGRPPGPEQGAAARELAESVVRAAGTAAVRPRPGDEADELGDRS